MVHLTICMYGDRFHRVGFRLKCTRGPTIIIVM